MISLSRAVRSLLRLLLSLAILFSPSISNAQTQITPDQMGFGTAQIVNSKLKRGGSDIGDEINKAYANLPSPGGLIYVAAPSSGACYNYTTPINFTTVGKFVLLQGLGTSSSNTTSGVCLNYTPITATNAISIDWGNSGGAGNNPGQGIRDIRLMNNGCTTNGGCGSSAVGVNVGAVNGGFGENGLIQTSIIEGFGKGINYASGDSLGNGWGVRISYSSIVFNTTGINYTVLHENDECVGCILSTNGTAVNEGAFGTELSLIGGSVDANTTCGVTLANGAILHASKVHWENTTGGTPAYVCGGATAGSSADIEGGIAQEDSSSGVANSTNWFLAGFVSVHGLQLIGNGTRVTNVSIVSCNTRCGFLDVINQAPTQFATLNGAITANILANLGNSSPAGMLNLPVWSCAEQATPSSLAVGNVDNVYCDSTSHTPKASYNASNVHKVMGLYEQGSCAMSSATTCTFSIGASFSSAPLTYVSIDGASVVPATANSAKCAVSGTTVTITAGISNSLTWDCLLVGNPN